MSYSPNPKVQSTIEALLAIGCPPIPVAPKQDARKEWCHRVAKTKEGDFFCAIDKNLNPIPKFGGKNPSYLDHNGSPRICKHGEFQNRLPTDAELRRFFCHPDTGVGTLGGHAGINWLDFDVKCYKSQAACDADVVRIIEQGNLHDAWIERTGSGGWRIAVKPCQKPKFTNFATEPNGVHTGESLGRGRFTVLAPTIHPNGNPYRRTGTGLPIEVQSLQAIGIYPSKDEVEQAERQLKREQRKAANPLYGEVSDPKNNPWDIRNFAHYFEGFHDRGNGWAAAKCPHHNGTSQSSFRVKLSTGEFKLWCGCGTKDVYKSGMALAIAQGYEPPNTSQEFGSSDDAPSGTPGTRQREAEDAIYQNLTTIQEKPWKTINTPKINLEELLTEPGVIYIVSSAKGTHKTNALIPIVESQDKVLAWFNRVALGREECNRIGLTWKDETKSYNNKNKRGFCADSSFQFNPNILADKGLLIGDECDQVFAHMFGDTCNKDGKRPLILATLEAHIESAIHGGGMALFMSADVTQRDIDYIKALAPEDCPVRLIINEFKPDRGTIDFDVSDKPDGQIEELLIKLEEGIPCFVIDDIKNGTRGCKSIAEYIRSVHPEWADEIIEINSDTSGDQFIIDYLKTINEASKKTRLLCCSPSVVSGISIENGHFGGVFAFLNGILTVSDASQAIARVRGAKELHIWAAEEGLDYEANRSTNPEEIKAWYQRNYEANCKHLLTFKMEYEPITGEWASPHFDLFCKNAAYRNLCMSRLRERLKTRLEQEGYELVITSNNGSDSVEKILKQGWNQIELAQAHAIAAANILSNDELEALRYSNRPTTPEEKLDLQKTYLLKWFGQELIEATRHEHKSGELVTGYAAMALKNERGVYREQLENFRLLTSDEDAAVAKDVAAENKQLRHSHGRFPGDVRWNTRRLKARRWLGLHQFLNPEKWWQPNDYRAMGQKAKSKAPMIKDCLNLATEKISEGQIFGELIQQLGLELEKEWVTPQPGKKRFKQRRISAESWNYAQMYLAHQQRLVEEREATHEPTSIEEMAVVEVRDSGCANLITPPQIYIQGSFFGGGDQKKASEIQGDLDSSNVAISTPLGSELEQVIECLPFCDSPHELAAVIEDVPLQTVENAIALSGDQPRRQQLQSWLEALNQPVDDSWVVLALKDIAESDKFETLKELVKKPQISLESLRRLSPKIQEKGGSLEPYQRLKLMLDALVGEINK
jgi:hypothetical protein